MVRTEHAPRPIGAAIASLARAQAPGAATGIPLADFGYDAGGLEPRHEPTRVLGDGYFAALRRVFTYSTTCQTSSLGNCTLNACMSRLLVLVRPFQIL